MCLAIPGKILKIKGQIAEVDFDGIVKDINIAMVDVIVGEYVMVHAGFAIEKMDMDQVDYIHSVIKKKK